MLIAALAALARHYTSVDETVNVWRRRISQISALHAPPTFSMVRVFILFKIRVSSIRSSLGLLVGGFFFRLHKDLKFGSRWSFFIGSSPVQSSLQEYLGVLVELV